MSNSMKLLYDPNNNMDKYEGVNSTKIKGAKGRNNQNKVNELNKVKKQVDKVEFSKDLSIGDSGKNVVELQTSLNKIGIYKDSIDGYYGKSTESAIKKFQKSKNMNENGIVNNKVKYELGKELGSTKSTYKRNTSRTVLYTAYDELEDDDIFKEWEENKAKGCSIFGCDWDDDMKKLDESNKEAEANKAKGCSVFGCDWDESFNKSMEELEKCTESIGKWDFSDIREDIRGIAKSMDTINSGLNIMNSAVDGMNSALDDMNSGLSDLNSGLDQANTGIKQMIQGVKAMNSGTDKMIEGIEGTNEGIDEINKVGSKVGKEVDGMIKIINQSISSVNGMVKGINEMSNGLGESNNAVNGMNSGVQKICDSMDDLKKEAIKGIGNLFKVATLQHSSSSSGTSNTNSYGNVSGSKVEEHYDVGLEEETGKEIVLAETNNIKVTLEKSISAGMPGKWVNASVTGREISVRGLVENTLLDNIKGLFGASAIDVSIGSISMSSEGVELNSSIDIYSEKEIKGITSTIKDSFKITGKITKDDINNIGKGAALVAGTALVIGAVSTEVGSLGISTPESIPAFIWGTKLLSRAI